MPCQRMTGWSALPVMRQYPGPVTADTVELTQRCCSMGGWSAGEGVGVRRRFLGRGVGAGLSTVLALGAGVFTNVATSGWTWPTGVGLVVFAGCRESADGVRRFGAGAGGGAGPARVA